MGWAPARDLEANPEQGPCPCDPPAVQPLSSHSLEGRPGDWRMERGTDPRGGCRLKGALLT